jgi:hypothetical protein
MSKGKLKKEGEELRGENNNRDVRSSNVIKEKGTVGSLAETEDKDVLK